MSDRMKVLPCVFVLVAMLGLVRCSGPSASASAGSTTSGTTSASAPSSGAAASDASASTSAPHGDHSPHHEGGTVLMHRDLHYEIVLEPGGRVALYLTDAIRKDLPASIVSDVVIEIDRPKQKVETIDMAIDGTGECWEGRGRPVKDPDANVRVAFTFQGEPVSVELPYRAYWKTAAAS